MKDTELELLKNKCLLYTQFVIQKLSQSPELIKGFEETYRLVEKAYHEERLKPLRAMSIEIDDQVTHHMPLSLAIEFKNLVREKLQISYDEVDKAHQSVIEKVLKRDEISDDEEYELITNRIDEIFADTTKAEELKSLNRLLLDYEKKNKI